MNEGEGGVYHLASFAFVWLLSGIWSRPPCLKAGGAANRDELQRGKQHSRVGKHALGPENQELPELVRPDVAASKTRR